MTKTIANLACAAAFLLLGCQTSPVHVGKPTTFSAAPGYFDPASRSQLLYPEESSELPGGLQISVERVRPEPWQLLQSAENQSRRRDLDPRRDLRPAWDVSPEEMAENALRNRKFVPDKAKRPKSKIDPSRLAH